MTRPRFSGVTNRITGITESMDKAFETIRATTIDLPKITVSPVLTEVLGRLSDTSELYDTEVNHRPAGQQCPVCTP